jgi:hypothetical protein
MTKNYITKLCLFTPEQIKWIKEFQELNGTKFATEVRALLDDYFDFIQNIGELDKCEDCRWKFKKRESDCLTKTGDKE